MRIYILLALCGLIQSSTASCLICDDVVELNYNNRGEGWFVLPNRIDYLKSLKGSGDEYITADSFYMDFNFPDAIDLVKIEVEFNNISFGQVEVFNGDRISLKRKYIDSSDHGTWQYSSYILGDPNAKFIRFRRSPLNFNGLTGCRNLAVYVCDTGPCMDSLIATDESLMLPPGLHIEVPGPSLNTSCAGFSVDPRAVMKGSNLKIKLRNDLMSENSIRVTFDSSVNIRTLNLKTKYAKGVIVHVYRDITATVLLFTRTVTIGVLNQWTDTVITAPIGAIRNLRRIDIQVIYDLQATNPCVNVKKLWFYTCA